MSFHKTPTYRCAVSSFAVTVLLIGNPSCAGGENTPDANHAVLCGTVMDTEGKPLAGSEVKINRCSGARVTDFGRLRTTTDQEGRYEIAISWTGGEQLTIHDIRVSHTGYVQANWRSGHALSPDDRLSVDFHLQRGEIIAGSVSRPLKGMEKQSGLTSVSMRYRLRIENEAFEQSLVTEPGGRFRVYVPSGTYSVHVIDPPIVRRNVPSGTADLVLQPAKVEITGESLTKAFDALWTDMNEKYSYFALKRVDWQAVRDQYRPRVESCNTLDEFVELLKECLARLSDMHVWLDTPEGVVGTFNRGWQRNWSPHVILDALTHRTECGDYAIVGTIDDGFGVLIVTKQSAASAKTVDQTLTALRNLGDVPGFIVDLRGGCSGGDERWARQTASFFCKKDVVYARSQYRAGPHHDAFSAAADRILTASKRAYTKPVVCLIGEKCMSSGEAFVQMMAALPNVTTVGMRTRGASGNPKPFALPGLPIQVWFSRWVDLMPDGTAIEGVGIAPDVTVKEPASAYDKDDPTWSRALALLREKVR